MANPYDKSPKPEMTYVRFEIPVDYLLMTSGEELGDYFKLLTIEHSDDWVREFRHRRARPWWTRWFR